ncbi:D-alanyl-D-alanine carboxypeptidase family protein [Streptomyces sp. HPF1205]|uniref:D-alanyl-D-alanine carboxypeptidase family protein n=1 Tax=Streptomyces sp. HPF1205 TaxID=2873262 RepID=UPI001CED2031|nr:D-alanyl-D-alanine carboxypeptidase [Streptomyces sp. HPF1205]
MTAFRPTSRARTRPRTATLAAVCCLAALPVASAAQAASARVPSAPAAAARVAAGRVPAASGTGQGAGPEAASRGGSRAGSEAGARAAGSEAGAGSVREPGSAVAAAAEAPAGGPLLSAPGVQVRPQDGTPDLPSGLSALSWLVSDARTGQVLAAKDAHRALPPASTLKTLFADTVLPRLPADTRHTVTESDLAGIGEGSSMVGVQVGHTYAVSDLWRGVFLASGNDAVHVLAHMNGSVPLTVTQMQAKARMLGAYDTHVVSPDGYDMPGQVSSAYDLALFARAGLANPEFAGYVSTATAVFPGGCDAHGHCAKPFGIQNTNRLLTGANGVTPYPGIIGVKNGYTTHAGNTLVAAARRGERTLIVTVMNPQSGVPQAVYREAAALLDWGFRAAGRTGSVGTLNAVPAAYHAPADNGRATTATHPAKPSSPSRSAVASPTAWYVGGALVLAAAVSVLLLRRRGPARAR